MNVIDVKLNGQIKLFIFFVFYFRNMFTVLLGDKIIFQPCGDSNGTNLVYTNNKTVFEQCIPESDTSSGTFYNHIGKSFDNESCHFIATLANWEKIWEREREGGRF